MKKNILTVALCVIALSASAQKAERDNIRKGNKFYQKEKYTEAEIDYRKSQEVNNNSVEAAFNLGNALYKQGKFEDAIKQYGVAAANTPDKMIQSDALYNTGNVFMSQEDYAKAIEIYKQSLRMNPKDDECRYNLALAQKLLQDQQQQDQQQDQNQDQEQDQQQDKQDQQQNQDQNKDQNQDQNQDQQQNQDQNQEQQENQQPQQSDQISKDVAEQILNALNQDEKAVQEKVQKAQMQQMERRKTDKEW